MRLSATRKPNIPVSLYAGVMCLYFLLAPFEDILNNEWGSLAKYVALAAVLCIAFYYIYGWVRGSTGHVHMRNSYPLLFLFPFWMFFLAWLSYLWAIDRSVTLETNVTYTLLPMLFIALYSVSFSRREYKILQSCILLGGLICAVFLTAQLSFTEGIRITLNEENDPNNLAALLLLPTVMLFCDALKEPKTGKRILQYVLFGYLSAMLFLTGSRGALVGYVAAMIAAVFVSGILKKPGRFLALLCAIAVLGTVILLVLPQETVSRLFTLESYIYTAETEGQRTDIWRRVVLYILPDLPFYGYGSGNGTTAISAVYGYAKGVHNTYLDMLIEYGLLGLPMFLWFLAEVCRRLKKKGAKVELAAMVGIMAVLFFLGSYAKKFFWNVLFLAAIYLKTDFNENEIEEEKV